MEESYYLALGRFSFYFIREDLERCQASIKYAHLERCLLDEKRSQLLQLQLSDSREAMHPQKLNIYSQDRGNLVDSFMCYWQIDYMYRYTTFAKFPLLDKQKIETKDAKDLLSQSQSITLGGVGGGSSRSQSKIPIQILQPPNQHRTVEYKGYRFFLPKVIIKRKGKDSEYVNRDNPKTTFLIQVSDCQPVDDLTKMPDYRKDIQEFAQNLAISKIEEERTGDKKSLNYFIIESKPYVKKQNLNSDKALWTCWQVHSRTETYDLYVTVLRRKYIPPLMEVFQDIICISCFDFSQDLEDEEESKEALKFSKQYLQVVHQQACDTLHSSSRFASLYKNIIDEKANALLMDEDSIDFNHYNLNVMPMPGIKFAVNYLESLLGTLGKYNIDICRDLRRQLKTLKLIKQDEYLSTASDKDPDQSAKIARNFEIEALLEFEEAKNDSQSHAWPTKIANYLAHCVDGGLLCSQFTIQTLIKLLGQVTETKDEYAVKKEIQYLLNVRKVGMRYERTDESIASTVKNLVSSPGEYVFNERVLMVLIESGYIQEQFSLLNPGEYPGFLKYILQSSQRIKLKEAACRQIIKLFQMSGKNESKQMTPGAPLKGTMAGQGAASRKEEESSKIEFINLVDPLISTMKTQNFNLASLSASALVNLCNYSDDIKDIFIQKNGLNAILEYLTCKEEDCLLNILRLLLALIANSEPLSKLVCESNNSEAIHSLLSVLKGPAIPNTKFGLKITFFALAIIRALVQYSIIPKSLFVRDVGAQEAVIGVIDGDKVKGVSEQVEVCVYSFFTQVIREEVDYKRILGRKLLPLCAHRLSHIQEIPFQSPQCETKFIKMLSVLTKKCKENIYMVRGPMRDSLQYYMQRVARDVRVKNKVHHIIVLCDTFEE
ncbi:hypothetical protein FGO68_gene15236 [Halteria grandinella]|uniref:Uncharacterized protein n=1 Tax=Halteria grandinella TaxID=5974 RepID=A0A8J8T866_HALGN|nr:hypothetical protein FGO68_gene15236 [Halteria grandinella]